MSLSLFLGKSPKQRFSKLPPAVPSEHEIYIFGAILTDRRSFHFVDSGIGIPFLTSIFTLNILLFQNSKMAAVKNAKHECSAAKVFLSATCVLHLEEYGDEHARCIIVQQNNYILERHMYKLCNM